MSTDRTWINHAEWVILFITLVGGFYLIDSKIERSNERTDRLYEIFMDHRKDVDQKFYDMLKESKK